MPPVNMFGVKPAQRRHPQVRGKNVPVPNFNTESQTAGTKSVNPGVERLIDFTNASQSLGSTQGQGSQFSLPRLGAVPMKPGSGSAFAAGQGAKGWQPETPGQLQARALGQSLGISNIGGFAQSGHVTNSDHYHNRAYDFMTGANTAQGYNLISQLQPQWSKLGIKYVIFNGQINKGNGWQPYRPPGGKTDATSMHRDHVHVSFY